jgi:hypothetical protein
MTGVVNIFRNLPGNIVRAIGNVSSLLWNTGWNIIRGLIRGIESAIPGLSFVLRGITNLVPKEKGPMDVDLRLLRPSGAAIIRGLTHGIQDEVPVLRQTLGDVTAQIPATAAAATNASASGSSAPETGGVRVRSSPSEERPIVIQLVGDANEETQYLLKRLRKAVRVGGGNVQFVLGGTKTAPGGV